MKLKVIFQHLPLMATLLLMGCSYGCDSNNVKTEYEDTNEDLTDEAESREVEAEIAPLEEENLEETIEEISEEDPVIPPDSEDAPEEDFVDGDESEQPMDSDDSYGEEPASSETYMQEGEMPEAQSQEEDYENQDEPYVDDGQVYEDDYPD